jgi:hypothetical protein
VGHSIAGVELSSVANGRPVRVAGLVYLDAAYSYALDDGKGARIMDMQRLQGPQPRAPSKEDLVSFSALQKYLERVNGFRSPNAHWLRTSAGIMFRERSATIELGLGTGSGRDAYFCRRFCRD